MYAIITENDECVWKNDTGVLYHFPKRYKDILVPGTKVVYYKGTLKNKAYTDSRLSDAPHYFGIAEIGDVYPDKESKKKDLFATVIEFKEFQRPVIAKVDGEYYEEIPENKVNNYWRDGVRRSSEEVYSRIVSQLAEGELTERSYVEQSGDDESVNDEYESFEEGSKSKVYTTKYERDPRLRRQAIAIHGTICKACAFDFEERYGELGKGFIHIHHIEPLFKGEEPRKVNPKTDLVPLCPNCHAMVHRQRSKTLSIEELKELMLSAK